MNSRVWTWLCAASLTVNLVFGLPDPYGEWSIMFSFEFLFSRDPPNLNDPYGEWPSNWGIRILVSLYHFVPRFFYRYVEISVGPMGFGSSLVPTGTEAVQCTLRFVRLRAETRVHES